MNREIAYSKLRTFYYIAKEKSFKKAADLRLFVTVGALSQQIKSLEDQLGKKLFERIGKEISLTPDGSNLFDLVAPIVEKCDSIGLEFERMSGTIAGQVKIASFTAMFLYIFPKYLESFRKLYPECELILFNVSGKEIRSKVLSGEADFGIGSVYGLPEEIEGLGRWNYDRYLIAPLGHPLSKLKRVLYEDIAKFPVVMPDKGGTGGKRLEKVLRGYNPNLKVTMEAVSWEVVMKYVELGYGVSAVPELVIQPKDKKRFFISNISQSDKRAGLSIYGILTKKGKYMTPAARELIKFLSH